ncbi:MAG: DNA-binding response regulator [Gammaproteobacteria bacterium]|nr:MAG: DNA-binding response regulator [Gammaproteobacteria bacterium]
MIKVVVVDDQTLVRQGICTLLELSDKVQIVGQADNGLQALNVIEETNPDIILSDIRMPEMDGIQLVAKLAELKVDIPIILLTTFDDHETVLQGIQSGARGYMLKDVSLEQLVGAIETVMRGETMVQPAITERVLKGLVSGNQADDSASNNSKIEKLTGRETEVLRMMSGGYSNKEIASAMSLSEGTVKNHVSNVLSKLGVRDRTRAVLKAVEAGIL